MDVMYCSKNHEDTPLALLAYKKSLAYTNTETHWICPRCEQRVLRWMEDIEVIDYIKTNIPKEQWNNGRFEDSEDLMKDEI